MAVSEVRNLFQCPRCGLGSYEVGHLVSDDEVFCVVCLEEEGLQIRLQRWEETADDQARLREPLAA